MKVILQNEETNESHDLGDMSPSEAKALIELYEMANILGNNGKASDAELDVIGAFIEVPTNTLTIFLENKKD